MTTYDLRLFSLNSHKTGSMLIVYFEINYT